MFTAQIRSITEYGPARDADGPLDGEETKVKIAKEKHTARKDAKSK